MLLPCAAEPDVPVGAGVVYDPTNGQNRVVVTDAQAADYMVGLRAAGQDCRSRHEWFRKWFSELPD
jgi:hypothetical protein